MPRPFKYTNWTDFDIEEIGYGLGAPLVGCGTYTSNKKYSWPDRQCTMKKEYDRWVQHLHDNGFEVPEEYLNAYVEYSSTETKTGE